MLSVIENSGNNLLNMVREVLDRESKKKVPESLNVAEVPVVDLIERVISMNKAKSMLKEIDLTFSVDPSNLQAHLDQNKIEIAINNLVSNALKFTPARGSVSVSAYKNRSLLHIEIEDTGIGIPESMQGDIFENNIKYSRKGTGGEAGTGLGLDIVQLYVELHGGKIRVESTENEGTTFFIEIPLEPEMENK